MHVDSSSLALALLVGLGVVTAAAFLATSWWRGGGKAYGIGSSSKKRLAHTPGVRVVRIEETSSETTGGWDSSSRGDGHSSKGSKWEQSKQKGDLGYYFAHHITMKELAPEDYQMNGPRLLSKGDPAVAAAPTTNGSPPNKRSLTATQRRRPQQITSYSWEDYGEEIRLTFRQSEWDWTKVEAEDVVVEWSKRRFRMSIDSSEYGLHAIDLQRLNGDVAGVRVRKLKSRLVAALVKAKRGSYGGSSTWTQLQAAPAKPTD